MSAHQSPLGASIRRLYSVQASSGEGDQELGEEYKPVPTCAHQSPLAGPL